MTIPVISVTRVGVQATVGPDKEPGTWSAALVVSAEGLSGRLGKTLGLVRREDRPLGVGRLRAVGIFGQVTLIGGDGLGELALPLQGLGDQERGRHRQLVQVASVGSSFLPQLAGGYVDKRVVDETGLPGAWEFTVEWTQIAQLENNGGMTLFASLQAQLGLQLVEKKLPVSVVVVDNMEKTPTDN